MKWNEKCAQFLFPYRFKYEVPTCRELRLHEPHHRAGEAALRTVTRSSVKGVKLNTVMQACSDPLWSGWFLPRVQLFFISVVSDDPFIDAFQPQSLPVQVPGPRSRPGGEKPPWKTQILPKQGELCITLYSLGQTRGKAVERLVYLCVDLH